MSHTGKLGWYVVSWPRRPDLCDGWYYGMQAYNEAHQALSEHGYDANDLVSQLQRLMDRCRQRPRTGRV
jgi:hypothetical protein